MINEPTTAHEQVRALATAVRDGELTPKQRECLISLIYSLGTAVTLAPRAERHYPDSDAAALGYLTATWAPVTTAYADLAATVRSSGEEHTA